MQQSAGLTFTLVVVGCSGSGPSDDNVGELLKWLHKGFSGLGDQHFALTTDDNIDTWPPGVTVVRGARERYETALRLYHEAGEVLAEANCVQGLGDVDEANKDPASARGQWSEALALYGRIPERYSIGHPHRRPARHAATPTEAAGRRDAARQAWASIDRADLIATYLDATA